MRTFLLATTVLVLGSGAAPAQTVITPGSGPLTDSAGNVWLITADGSIRENGQWTPGGGGTAALTIVNGTVYGEDNSGKGWFALSGSNQFWMPADEPAGLTLAPVIRSALPQVATAVAAPAASAAAAPATPATCAATPGGPASGGFTTSNGQIIAPDGSVYIAKGINVMEGQEPSLSTLRADFPGINFVRYAIYDYASPSTLSAWVTSLTAAGIVVEIEDHNNGAGNAGGGQGVVFTGQILTTELKWYTAIAKAFASNPNVWFGTDNEPSEVPSAAALSTWQAQTVQAVRSAGNASPIMVEMNSAGAGKTGTGYTASAYAGMTNIIWDIHYYGWVSGYSTDQAKVNSTLASMVSQAQQITGANGTVPIMIGEYGNSTTGVAIDPNAQHVLTAVQSSGYGSGAWAWGKGNPGDGLSDGGNGLSSYGQEVAGYIALVASAPASIWATNCGATASVTTSAAPVATTTAAPDASTAAATSDVPAPEAPYQPPGAAALLSAGAAQIAHGAALVAAQGRNGQ